jgi:hypothetical protein
MKPVGGQQGHPIEILPGAVRIRGASPNVIPGAEYNVRSNLVDRGFGYCKITLGFSS